MDWAVGLDEAAELARPLARRDGFVQHPGESVGIAQFPVSSGIVVIGLQGVAQQRHSLLNVSRIYQEIGEEHLRIKQIGAYRQSLLVRGLGTAILLAPAKLECCV